MDEKTLQKDILEIAREYVARGPGWAQESVVLREAAERLKALHDEEKQRQVLAAWHDLFRKGVLCWGYNIDNPSNPFFHIPRQPQEKMAT